MADHLLEAHPLAAPERLHLLLQPAAVQRAGHHHLELGHLERLGEEVVGAATDGVDGDLPGPVRGHDDDGRLGRQLAALGDGLEPVHVGQLHVQQDQVVGPAPEAVEEGARGRGDLDLVLLADQGLPEDERQVLVVLADHDALSRAPHGGSPLGRAAP